ncbi:plasmid replication, integration and excision activator [Actinomycetospora sp. TBRC 11914]|uniref:plasmid replication, integration and excision activator n=1 Tax=Actinomycetospora sp. TBRC 11914 TaxID=2729387 RepID=UPI00145E5E64|nr:plasmid replication, integration and excision activator [Actinomycetospora sp. TBRC 11914]NMO93515.1 plasmid replication, integration and excision activator [Actinomycetospora sp. TBRC 11914]
MAIKRRLRVAMEDVFPHGAFLTTDGAEPVRDFDRSSKDKFVQQHDTVTGLPLWEVGVHDPDPEARKAERSVTVKIAAEVQPVPPEALPGLPFRPVEFEGLEVTPYLDSNSPRPRVAFSLRATGMHAPGQNRRHATSSGKSAEAVA